MEIAAFLEIVPNKAWGGAMIKRIVEQSRKPVALSSSKDEAILKSSSAEIFKTPRLVVEGRLVIRFKYIDIQFMKKYNFP
jgi:hypothetical protein